MRQHMKDYIEFGHSGGARGTRILAEYLSAWEAFERLNGQPLLTVFGSARLGEGTKAGALAEDLSRRCVTAGYGIVTGGSAGVMLSANKGAYLEAKARGLPVERCSIGCAITLPFEEGRNQFLGTQTDFHYFFIRKFFLVAYSRAFFFLEGGAGTRDELWEVFCLIQTGKMPITPLIAVGEPGAWQSVRADLTHMAERGTISPDDVHMLRFADSPAKALEIVRDFYRRVTGVRYDKTTRTIQIGLKSDLTRDELAAIEKRFSQRFSGVRWHPDQRLLAISQFNLRSYATVYELVEVLNGTASGS